MKPIKDTLAYCSCQEIKDKNGKEFERIPHWHNCDYIRKRNKLIPQAEEFALLYSMKDGKMDTDKFTKIFSRQMDSLAFQAGLVA